MKAGLVSRIFQLLPSQARSSLPPSTSGGTCGKRRAWNGAFAALHPDQEGQSAVLGLSEVWWEFLEVVDSWVIAQPAGTESKARLVKQARQF